MNLRARITFFIITRIETVSDMYMLQGMSVIRDFT